MAAATFTQAKFCTAVVIEFFFVFFLTKPIWRHSQLFLQPRQPPQQQRRTPAQKVSSGVHWRKNRSDVSTMTGFATLLRTATEAKTNSTAQVWPLTVEMMALLIVSFKFYCYRSYNMPHVLCVPLLCTNLAQITVSYSNTTYFLY